MNNFFKYNANLSSPPLEEFRFYLRLNSIEYAIETEIAVLYNLELDFAIAPMLENGFYFWLKEGSGYIAKIENPKITLYSKIS